jgi:hypothetical protein
MSKKVGEMKVKGNNSVLSWMWANSTMADSLSAKQHWVRSGHIGYGLFWRHG